MPTINKIHNCPPLRFPDFTDEWTQTTLGEIASFCGGGTPSSEIISYWNGHIPWISSSDISTKSISNINTTRFISEEALSSSATKLCKAPCIVIVSRVGVGKLAYSENDICTSQDFCNMYDIKGNYIFMSYRLLPIMNKKSLEVQGTSIKGITMQEIKSLLVSLPSIAEQKKIADFLSLIDERIQSCSETIKELKTQKAGLLNQLFSEKLRFPDFNDEWRVTTLGEVAEKKRKKNNDNAISKVYSNSAQLGIIEQTDFFDKEIANSNNLRGYYIVEYLDFIYNPRISSWAPVGAMNLNKQTELGIVSPLYTVFRIDQRIFNPYFVGYLFKSSVWHTYMKQIANYGARDDRMNIKDSDFFALPISLPTLAEQKKIADFLSLIDERIEVEEQLLKQYEKQRRYLLRKMFV